MTPRPGAGVDVGVRVWRRGMRIGELARRAGTTTRALRHYESPGLLRARRTANGYRDYGEEDLRLLRQIRTLQDFGLELEETRPFVECLRAGHPTGDACPASLEVYRRELACIDRLRTVRRGISAQLSRAETTAGGADGQAWESSAPEPRCLLSPCEPPGPRGSATDGPPDTAARKTREIRETGETGERGTGAWH